MRWNRQAGVMQGENHGTKARLLSFAARGRNSTSFGRATGGVIVVCNVRAFCHRFPPSDVLSEETSEMC